MPQRWAAGHESSPRWPLGASQHLQKVGEWAASPGMPVRGDGLQPACAQQGSSQRERPIC